MNTIELESPRIEECRALCIAGLLKRYSHESSTAIPAQWERFNQLRGQIPHAIPDFTYGVCLNFDSTGHFDYLAGIELNAAQDLPGEVQLVELPPQRCAVFTYRGHIADIKNVIMSAWSKGLPDAGLKANQAPSFERYSAAFNPHTGEGGFEIWIPVEK